MNYTLTNNYKYYLNSLYIRNLLEFFLSDFMFFILFLKNYIQYNNSYLLLILNKFLIKYMLYIKYIKVYIKVYNTQTFFYNYIFSNLYIFPLYILYKQINIKNIQQKIILIKKISRTRKKGRIRRYKIILIIGNKSGWFGYGYSKDYNLQEAILKARKKAFNNITYIPMYFFIMSKKYTFSLNKKNRYLYISINNKNSLCVSKNYIIRSFFECVGIYNITSKKIKFHNKYHIIKFILNLFK